jgi:putative salt-induced outer membrane protein
MTARPCLLLAATLLALPGLAEAKSWSGSAELGLAIASGNADSETLNGKFRFKREMERWFYTLEAAALRAESNDALSANRYEAGSKFGYRFSERAYSFGALRHEDDDFAAFRWQTVVSGGLGYTFLDDERTKLQVEGGPGVRRVQPVDVLVGLPPVPTRVDAETDTVLRGTLTYSRRIGENTQLANDLLVESGGGSTFLKNDLGLTVQMTERLALKAAYQVRHTTEVPEPLKKTDTLFTTNLVVGF